MEKMRLIAIKKFNRLTALIFIYANILQCVHVCLYFPGRVWLCCELPEECSQHPHRLHALHVYLRCYRCAALQGQILLLHRRVQGPGEGLQVLNKHVSFQPHLHICLSFPKSTRKFVTSLYMKSRILLFSILWWHSFLPSSLQRSVSGLWQGWCGSSAQRVEEVRVSLW